MKKIGSLLTIAALTLYSQNSIFGQTFLNGSFETTTANCNYGMVNVNFNNTVSNNFAFGSASQIDVMNGTCGYGTAQQGNYFVGLAVDISNTLVDAFSLKLTAPLVAGNTYVLNFYGRKDPGYNANLVEVGYSNDSLSFGNTINTAALPTTSWGLVSFSFSPTINCKYITVRTIAGTYGWNFVDDFTITETTGIVDNMMDSPSVHLFPNPTATHVTVSSDKQIASVLVYDFTGKLMRQIQANTFESTVDISDLPKGFYSFNITMNDRSQKTMKVVKD
jgi:hypothetical protein